MTSMVALSIDAMLPALPEIAGDLGAERLNDSQYVILIFFAGMALGQLFFGPLSDCIGRRPAIIAGVILYAAASLLSLLAVCTGSDSARWALAQQFDGPSDDVMGALAYTLPDTGLSTIVLSSGQEA